jgi:hypothetical protein
VRLAQDVESVLLSPVPAALRVPLGWFPARLSDGTGRASALEMLCRGTSHQDNGSLGVTYRPGPIVIVASRILAVILACLLPVALGISVLSIVRGQPAEAARWGLLYAPWAAGGAALMWRQSRLCVVADETGLAIVNYLSNRRLAWSEIERFDSSTYGYFGIAVVTKGGRVIRMSALQKSHAARWFNVRVRADRIALELSAQLQDRAA